MATSLNCFSQNKYAYPVIFVHGLADYDGAFAGSMEYLRDHDDLGEINVFDIVLNADDDSESSIMSEDVKWEDFVFDGDEIKIGRRNYADDIDDYTHEWSESNLFAINFQEEKIEGASGFFNDYFDQSNQAGIFKQGYALNKMIQEVLNYTGAEKVILVGHSMGGVCIREYLQRTDGNNIHVNWIDPTTEDGHKVARVITFGTPHLGSNTSPDPTKSDIPDELGKSEANRDLLFEYDSYNFCESYPQGIYMFGGNENCIASEGGIFGNSTFDNVDINCNGSQTDDIVGINESPDSYSYNSEMPLPTNIKYTYLTSIWIGWDIGIIGDGAVDIERQWLYDEDHNPVPLGITDTLLTDVFHTTEGNDYLTVVRGLDEPKQFDLAYGLNLEQEVIGYVTFQQDRIEIDEDVFKIECGDNPYVGFVYEGELSGVHTIEFYNMNQGLISSEQIDAVIDTAFVLVPEYDSEVFVKLIGTATPTTWENPYHIYAFPGDITKVNIDKKNYLSIFPNPSTGIIKIQTSNNTSCNVEITNSNSQVVYSANNISKDEIDLSFLENGVYVLSSNMGTQIQNKRIIILR